MKNRRLAVWAALFLLLGLLKLLFPDRAEALRLRAEEIICPGSVEVVEAWGRAFSGDEERVEVLAPQGKP